MQSEKKKVLSVLLAVMLSFAAFSTLPVAAYAAAPVLTNIDETVGYDYVESNWTVDVAAEVWYAIYEGDGAGITSVEVQSATGTGLVGQSYSDFRDFSGTLPIDFSIDFGGLHVGTAYTIYAYADYNGESIFTELSSFSTGIPPVPVINNVWVTWNSIGFDAWWEIEDDFYEPYVYVAVYADSGEKTIEEVIAAVDAVASAEGYASTDGYAYAQDGYYYFNLNVWPLDTNTAYTIYLVAQNLTGNSILKKDSYISQGQQPPAETDKCAIYIEGEEDMGFRNLDDAVNAFPAVQGEYIYLLQDIDGTTHSEVIICETDMLIDTQGHDLVIYFLAASNCSLIINSSVDEDWDLTVVNDLSINISDDCYLEITATNIYAKVIGASNDCRLNITADKLESEGFYISTDSIATINIDEIIIDNNSVAVESFDGSQVEVHGNITTTAADYPALYADGGATITLFGNIVAVYGAAAWDEDTEIIINGNIFAAANGIEAYDDAVIKVNGNITAGNLGALADNFADVTMTGDITARYGVRGGNLEGNGAFITVIGDIFAEDLGVLATLGSDITIIGDITVVNPGSDEAAGVGAIEGSLVTVTGNIKATIGVIAGEAEFEGATVLITGNILAELHGIVAENSSVVEIVGNITVSDPVDGVGVSTRYGSEVTVDGVITARYYIGFDDGEGNYDYRGINDNTSTSLKAGYRQYVDTLEDASYVWVRTPTIPPTTPPTGDSLALGLLIVFFLSTLGAIGLLARRRALIIKG